MRGANKTIRVFPYAHSPIFLIASTAALRFNHRAVFRFSHQCSRAAAQGKCGDDQESSGSGFWQRGVVWQLSPSSGKFRKLRCAWYASPDIHVIGVGESTTPNVPAFLFDYLGISRRRFYQLAEPTWKLGIHFLWGPRESFEYSFLPQLDVRIPELPRPNGYYCDDDFSYVNPGAALMTQGKSFLRRADGGGPEIDGAHAFHLENVKFVRALEQLAVECGVEFIDGKMSCAEPALGGIGRHCAGGWPPACRRFFH